jgi:hypothetical protein
MQVLEPAVSLRQLTYNVTLIGSTFCDNSQWHTDENELIEIVGQQISRRFYDSNNLLINLTWFGPQFADSAWYDLHRYVNQFDQVFLLSSVDAAMITQTQIDEIANLLKVKQSYLLGNFDTAYQFSFIATLLPKYFKTYSQDELVLQTPKWLYVAYNRKPRQHRVDLVNNLLAEGLDSCGLISLGAADPVYSQSNPQLVVDQSVDYGIEGNWGMDDRYGIAHDIHTLGDLNIWRNHFLHIVGETEFLPWDPMFITEKTWKPIIGMRPFVINGQSKIYKYLTDNGFRTFNHYWPHIPVESGTDIDTYANIIEVIKYLSCCDSTQLFKMFQDMLPDLQHNRLRFFEFSIEQKNKIQNLFL